MGVTGSWEGWVPTATDLYVYGTNYASFTATPTRETNVYFDAGQIRITSSVNSALAIAQKAYNFTPYNYINFHVYYDGESREPTSKYKLFGWNRTSSLSYIQDGDSQDTFRILHGENTYSVNITYTNEMGYPYCGAFVGKVYRIWLS